MNVLQQFKRLQGLANELQGMEGATIPCHLLNEILHVTPYVVNHWILAHRLVINAFCGAALESQHQTLLLLILNKHTHTHTHKSQCVLMACHLVAFMCLAKCIPLLDFFGNLSVTTPYTYTQQSLYGETIALGWGMGFYINPPMMTPLVPGMEHYIDTCRACISACQHVIGGANNKT